MSFRYTCLVFASFLAMLPAVVRAVSSTTDVHLNTLSRRAFHGGHAAVAITPIWRGTLASSAAPLGNNGRLREPVGETKRISAVSTELYDMDGVEYVGPIGVGTAQRPLYCQAPEIMEKSAAALLDAHVDLDACKLKEQSKLNVVFDTGSTNLWITSDLCTDAPCNKSDRHRYNHTLSETYKDSYDSSPIAVTFGTAELDGYSGTDNFHVGPLTVKSQTFNLIAKEVGSTFNDIPLEGIVGLAFPSMHASDDLAFFDNVIKQKVLTHNEFAFSMHKDGTSSILWGGVDPTLFVGELRMFPVTQAHYWAIDLHEVQLGSTIVDMGANAGSTAKLIFDSGTTLFATKESILRQIRPQGAMDCSETTSLPDLVFKLKDAAGHFYNLELRGDEYTVPIDESSSRCDGAFMEVEVREEYGPAILVGETFMNNFFTVFDRGDGSDEDARVGFARARHNPRVQANANLRIANDSFLEDNAARFRAKGPKRRSRPGLRGVAISSSGRLLVDASTSQEHRAHDDGVSDTRAEFTDLPS